MKTTCLINNYNYASYVGEAIDSALCQTQPFDEIIVVDDGSSDDSLSVIEKRLTHSNVQVVAKRNQGQLSSFNAGFSAATGDILFFLDADDRYKPEYLARALECYANLESCDFLYCAYSKIGKSQGDVFPHSTSRDLGYSLIASWHARHYTGSVTSTVSVRKSKLDQILPLPLHEDWRTRADDCLIWGTSMAGARKYYLAAPLVEYRVHESNNYHGKKKGAVELYRHNLAIDRLFLHLQAALGNPANLSHLCSKEFSTIVRPSRAELWVYLDILFSSEMLFSRRGKNFLNIVRHYARSRSSTLERDKIFKFDGK